MNIAYLISAHTDAPQLRRLINALHTDAHYFIHIDKKSDINAFTSIIEGDNIHFIKNRVDVRWGTMLQVEYQMRLIRAAVEYPVSFDRLFLLSGLDYPIWSNEKIKDFLLSLGDKELLQGICMDSDAIDERYTDIYKTARPLVNLSFLSNKVNTWLSIVCRKLLKAIGYRKQLYFYRSKTIKDSSTLVHLYKGSSWWCITESLARFVLQHYESDEILRKYFSDSFGPDETLIQTIAFNSEEFASKCILKVGEYPGLAKLTPLHFIDYNPVIQIMTEKDYDRIKESGKMFARKFVSGTSDKLVELIDKERN